MSTNSHRVRWLVILIVVAVALLGGQAVLLALNGALPDTAEIQIAASMILGVSLLLVLLLIMAAGFALMQLSDPKEALGLPEGSIRALIALILILIFIMMGLFLYRNVADGNRVRLPSLSAAQVNKIPKDILIGTRELTATIPTYTVVYRIGETGITDTVPITLTRVTLDQIADLPKGAVVLSPVEDGTAPTYEASIRNEITEKGADLGQQLLTTVGTLVVAVAGFYFGSRAVAAARGETVPTSLEIERIVPNMGAASEEAVEITNLAGAGFVEGARVRLRRDDQKNDIEAMNVRVVSPSKITCTFSLKDKLVGKWDIIVINPDDLEGIKSEAFEIKQAEPTAKPSA